MAWGADAPIGVCLGEIANIFGQFVDTFWPNPFCDMLETLRWATDIAASIAGLERGVGVRGSCPRTEGENAPEDDSSSFENLAAWLQPLRKPSGRVAPFLQNAWHRSLEAIAECAGLTLPPNVVRSYHFAQHRSENLTAAENGKFPCNDLPTLSSSRYIGRRRAILVYCPHTHGSRLRRLEDPETILAGKVSSFKLWRWKLIQKNFSWLA